MTVAHEDISDHAETSNGVEEVGISVAGMDCASCVAHVEGAGKSLPGVLKAQVNLARGRATVVYEPGRATPTKIAEAITGAGYPAVAESPDVAAGNVEEQRLQ